MLPLHQEVVEVLRSAPKVDRPYEEAVVECAEKEKILERMSIQATTLNPVRLAVLAISRSSNKAMAETGQFTLANGVGALLAA